MVARCAIGLAGAVEEAAKGVSGGFGNFLMSRTGEGRSRRTEEKANLGQCFYLAFFFHR